MLEFLSIDIGTIIFTLCNLLILYLIFKHFLFGRVHKILDERQNDVAETYNKADESLEHAKSLESEYSSLMESAKEESAEIFQGLTKISKEKRNAPAASLKVKFPSLP